MLSGALIGCGFFAMNHLHAWRDGLGLGEMDPEAGLSEAEDPSVSAALDLDVLLDYVTAVIGGTREWLTRVNTHAFDTVPASSSSAHVPSARRTSTVRVFGLITQISRTFAAL